MTTSQLLFERSGERRGGRFDIVGRLTCWNCGYEVENDERYAYHVRLCLIPA
ncbi:MAG TPA: hypothetical protein VLV18_09445 [Terriglobales bacterium]|nr:hypothetical protein [Terriglobales bacterium]